MIFSIIGFLILIYGFKDLKKSFEFYLVYKLILVTNITLISVPGIPLLTVEMFMTLVYIVAFFSRGKKYQFAHMKFPYRIPFAILVICWLISSMLAIAGFKAELSNLIKLISEDILLIWLMWEVLETKEDFKLLYKYITIMIFASCVYGLFEYVIQSNPLTLYEATLIQDKTRSFIGLYTNMDRGYRIKSIFEHSIGAGINWSMYSIFTLWLWINGNVETRKKFPKLAMITAFMCIPCIILTKMRSSLLFFAIFCLSLIDFKKKRFYSLIVLGIVAVIVLMPLFTENISLFMSFFDHNAQVEVGGSSIETRVSQFSAALDVVEISPAFGLGNKFANVLPRSVYVMLYGMESIWLLVIVQYGLVGVIVYLFYAIWSFIYIPIKYKSKPIFFLTLAYWITYTATSVPGLKIHLFYLIVFYFIKISGKYKKSTKEGKIYGVYLQNTKIIYNCIKMDLEKEEY
ncbi:O-antigen ligase family protein [Faecalicoccus pleomorphus]|uniref:O-antigen ligase family protein n=1 Tax=Faecalicoccus pleomorphus TaxID=1323 RepID=UPI0018980BCF|nr:O-antigen ligase family protein [Faecalicoccus pleomorphus]MDB7984037.1 O-antigen ligase family protein [Faecalicoccus pleomorphus]